MALTKIQSGSFETGAIDTSDLSSNATIAFSSTSAFANALAPKITTVNVANSAFTVLDDTAVNVGGGYIVITGANFQSGASVLIDTTPASAVTFVNTSTLQVQIPAKAAASYNLYVVNPDGGTGIKVAGLNYSAEPSWVTSSPLSNQVANTAFNVTLSANGATSYAVAAGSTLPAGTSLLANGYFYGTVSIGAQTTYTFSVVATDAENQDSSKTFQVTVTLPLITGKLFVWGEPSPDYGQLGTGASSINSPTQIGASTIWSKIVNDYGGNFTAAIKTDGTLWVWGQGSYGQLGLNTTSNVYSPTQVGALTDWADVSVGLRNTTALRTNGTLWAWGLNNIGQLGLGNTVSRSSPVQVGTDATWSKIANVAAIKTDGTLWAWTNINGANNTYRSSPVQVGSATNWTQVSVGNNYGTAIGGGYLYVWGNGFQGRLGLNNTADSYAIQQLGSATWNSISAGAVTTAGIKTNGTLWAWGSGNNGQLGIGSRVYKSSPTQVGSATTWDKVVAGTDITVAIKTDGTLWTWGYPAPPNGTSGNLISTPEQIGTANNYVNISTGGRIAFAIKTT